MLRLIYLNIIRRCSNNLCQFCFCFKCQEQWHADATCEEYQQWKRDAGDEGIQKYIFINFILLCRAKEWIQRNTKQCPTCLAAIQKNGGCNHMTCRACKYEVMMTSTPTDI